MSRRYVSSMTSRTLHWIIGPYWAEAYLVACACLANLVHCSAQWLKCQSTTIYRCQLESLCCSLGCPCILKIGFELMPAGTACPTIKWTHKQIFRPTSSYLTDCTTLLVFRLCCQAVLAGISSKPILSIWGHPTVHWWTCGQIVLCFQNLSIKWCWLGV